MEKKKKEAYASYRQVKEDMKEYQTAKYNVDQFLNIEEQEKKEKQKEKSL